MFTLIILYPDLPNCNNLTMYYYMYFTTLLQVMYHIFSLHVFLNVWPNVTGALLPCHTQWVLSYTRQQLVGDRKGLEHVCRDQVTLASPMLGRSEGNGSQVRNKCKQIRKRKLQSTFSLDMAQCNIIFTDLYYFLKFLLVRL